VSKVFFSERTEGEVLYGLTFPVDRLLERYLSRSPKTMGIALSLDDGVARSSTSILGVDCWQKLLLFRFGTHLVLFRSMYGRVAVRQSGNRVSP